MNMKKSSDDKKEKIRMQIDMLNISIRLAEIENLDKDMVVEATKIKDRYVKMFNELYPNEKVS